jgi:hypothetical protein
VRKNAARLAREAGEKFFEEERVANHQFCSSRGNWLSAHEKVKNRY